MNDTENALSKRGNDQVFLKSNPTQLPSSLKVFIMPLTSEDIQRIAQLARLELQPQQSELMLQQLNNFFSVVEQINAVDTAGIEPLHTPLAAMQDMALRLREDTVTEAVDQSLNQRSAPALHDGLFLVPKVIE